MPEEVLCLALYVFLCECPVCVCSFYWKKHIERTYIYHSLFYFNVTLSWTFNYGQPAVVTLDEIFVVCCFCCSMELLKLSHVRFCLVCEMAFHFMNDTPCPLYMFYILLQTGFLHGNFVWNLIWLYLCKYLALQQRSSLNLWSLEITVINARDVSRASTDTVKWVILLWMLWVWLLL